MLSDRGSQLYGFASFEPVHIYSSGIFGQNKILFENCTEKIVKRFNINHLLSISILTIGNSQNFRSYQELLKSSVLLKCLICLQNI